MTETATRPQLEIEPRGCRSGRAAGDWLASWRVRNVGDDVITLVETWLPHERFHWERRKLEPAIRLRPGVDAEIEQPVRCAESPGTVVANAFLILRVIWGTRPWRVLARHRLEWDAAGPRPVCELITTQPVGFSSAAGTEPG